MFDLIALKALRALIDLVSLIYLIAIIALIAFITWGHLEGILRGYLDNLKGIFELSEVVSSCLKLPLVVFSCLELSWVVFSCLELSWVPLMLALVVLGYLQLSWLNWVVLSFLSCLEMSWLELPQVVSNCLNLSQFVSSCPWGPCLKKPFPCIFVFRARK